MTRRGVLALLCGCLLWASFGGDAWAAYQTCDGQQVDNDTLRCPDGSIPLYAYGNPPTDMQPKKPAPKSAQSRTAKFVGVWHTRQEGLSYAHRYDVPGATQMGGTLSLRPGDLTIGANGAFVWNTLSGLFGRWVALESEDSYGKDKPLAFKPNSNDVETGVPKRRRGDPHFEDTKWDFLLIISGGKTWHGKVDPDGRLRLRLDEEHVLFGTR